MEQFNTSYAAYLPGLALNAKAVTLHCGTRLSTELFLRLLA